MTDFSKGVRGRVTECLWYVYCGRQLIGTVIADNEETAFSLANEKFIDSNSGSTTLEFDSIIVQQQSRKRKQDEN